MHTGNSPSPPSLKEKEVGGASHRVALGTSSGKD